MWNDDDSGANEWDIHEEEEPDEEETSSAGRPAIEAHRVRSAASSGGRTSSNSHYSVDGFDYAYTRGMDYQQISQELAHAAVWSSLSAAPPEEQPKATSNDAWDVERDDDGLADIAPSPEPQASEEPLSLVGDADEVDAPFIILRQVPGDFRSLPAFAWATLHAAFRPGSAVGASQAKLRMLPADALEYSISGPLGNTEQRLDAIAEATEPGTTLNETIEEDAEAEAAADTLSGVGGDFRTSPKAAWNALHAPFSLPGKEEAPVEKPDDAERPATAEVLDEALAGEGAQDAAEAPAEAPEPGAAPAEEPAAAQPLPDAAGGGVAVACPVDMEEIAESTPPEQPAEPLAEAPQEFSPAQEKTAVAPDESLIQVVSERRTCAEKAESEKAEPAEAERAELQKAEPAEAEKVDPAHLAPPFDTQERAPTEAEEPDTEWLPLPEEEAYVKPTAEVQAEAEAPMELQATVSVPAEAKVSAVEEPPAEVTAHQESAEVSPETESFTVSKALPEQNDDKWVSEEQAGTRTPTAMEPSVDTFPAAMASVDTFPTAMASVDTVGETSVELPREAEADLQTSVELPREAEADLEMKAASVEESPAEEHTSTDAVDLAEKQPETKVEEPPSTKADFHAMAVSYFEQALETAENPSADPEEDPALESELDDNMPRGRVAPAESMDEDFGSPLGKTDKVLIGMTETGGVEDAADSSTDTVTTMTNVKEADPNELTADPGQLAEMKGTTKEDPTVKRKTKLGLEHEAWVQSVFSTLAADAPLDRPARKPGMQRMSTISIARALGCLPAMQQSASSPSIARDSHMAHAGTNSIRSPLSSAPMSSQPRSVWTPPSPPAPSSIRSQGSNELPKVPQLVSMPPTGLRLSPSNSANSEQASAARRCRSAVPGLDMTKVHMGYDDDEDTEDDHTSTLFKTQKGLTVSTETDGAKSEVPTLNMAVLQKKYSASHSNKLTHESGGPRGIVTSPPAPRGVPPGANARQELSEIPRRPGGPTPRTANRVDGRENLRPPSRGDNMVMGRPFDYWRGGRLQRRATMEEGAFSRLPQRNIMSAGGFGMGTSNLEPMAGMERRAVSASELNRPKPFDQYALNKAFTNTGLSSLRPASGPPSALPVSNSVPSLPNAVRDPTVATDLSAQGNLLEHDQWTLDAIGCVVADKKMPLNAPAVVRLPPVGKKTWPAPKWPVNSNTLGFNVQKRGKATIISHTHVHHHHHYHVKRPAAAAADSGSGVPVAGAVSM